MEQSVTELAGYLTEKYLSVSLASDAVHPANLVAVGAAEAEEGRQVWICIAGGPGSGKSTLAGKLVALLNVQAAARGRAEDVAMCVPMDGFHYRYGQRPCRSDSWNCVSLCVCVCVCACRKRGSKTNLSRPLQSQTAGAHRRRRCLIPNP